MLKKLPNKCKKKEKYSGRDWKAKNKSFKIKDCGSETGIKKTELHDKSFRI